MEDISNITYYLNKAASEVCNARNLADKNSELARALNNVLKEIEKAKDVVAKQQE